MDVIHIAARQAGSTAPTSSSTSTSVSATPTSTPSSSSSSLPPTSTTSEKPFFPDPSTLPTPTQTSEQQQQARRNDTAKSILEFLFLAFAFLIIISMLIRRAIRLRNQGIPLSQFFRRSRTRRYRSMAEDRERVRFPRTTGLPIHGLGASPLPYHLAELPAAYTPDRGDRYAPHLFEPSRTRRVRIRAADIDAGGRRVDHGERDWDADDDADLPPYDKHGGPPVYVDVLGVRALQTSQRPEALREMEASTPEESRRAPEHPAIPPALHGGSTTLTPMPNTQPPRYSAAGEIARDHNSS